MSRRKNVSPAMRTTIAAPAARGGAPAIYNHAEFVGVGILMGCGTGIRGAYHRSAEPPAAVAPAIDVESASSPGIALPGSAPSRAGRMAP